MNAKTQNLMFSSQKDEYASSFCAESDMKYCFIINDNNKKQINVSKFNIILEG